MNVEFEKELKELLTKHNVELKLYCNDLTAILSYDDSESKDNLICVQEESMYEETAVNDHLNKQQKD